MEEEKLYIRSEGKKYQWSAYPDFYPQYWETSDAGDGIISVDIPKNTRRCVVGTCAWSTCKTDKATRAKIRKWCAED